MTQTSAFTGPPLPLWFIPRFVVSRNDESLTAKGYTLVDLYLGYRHRFWEIGAVIENLFNRSWREAQFANQSQLRLAPYNETEPVTDIHFTPGNPINVRATASLYF